MAAALQLLLPPWLFSQLNSQPIGGFIFPRPFPGPAQPVEYRVLQLAKEPLSTLSTSHTKITSEVQNMPLNLRLNKVKVSDRLWERLVTYAGVNPAQPGQRTTFSARGANQPLLSPEQQQQGAALFALFGWFISRVYDKNPAVGSERAIASQIEKQLLQAVDYFLRYRYENMILCQLPPGVVLDNMMMDRTRCFKPCWSQTNNATRADAAVNNPKKAGYSDFTLFASSGRDQNLAAVELKNWWAYRTHRFLQIIDEVGASRILGPDGSFDWLSNGLSSDIVMQIWSEMTALRASWILLTNGHVVYAAVKTGNQELTLSTAHYLTDPDTLLALTGMCFAAVDGRVVEDVNALAPGFYSVMPADNAMNVGLINYLCSDKRVPGVQNW